MPVLQWHIGSSGFHYKEWKEVFYPKGVPQRLWLDYYCQHFNTIELNVTFYRFPQLSFLVNWYQKTPAHFSFAVKAPRLITHYKKFHDCKLLLDDFYNTIQKGLQEKLGCVLFQLPAQLAYSEELLQKIVQQLSPSFINVVEFRHVSWWQPQVYEALSRHRICFCSISHPTLPDEVINNTDVIYYRFHGVPDLYYSAYDESFLQQVITAIQTAKQAKQAFVYFNNTAATSAIYNARFVQQLVSK
ncbi:DUF72 domain-containing protein [Longitalea luteola]|uniref:DUF72 domain-containing protein n=1 Tax=Longitalea luteola TaxID=2812563 RepID=UPI001A962D9F|nr:DUF72 domain-containing protein [Longitalea luteola]